MITRTRCCVAVALWACALLGRSPDVAAAQGIDHHQRLLMVNARVRASPEAVVLIATKLGRTAAVIEGVTALGGSIEARFDDVGYLRARLSMEKVPPVLALRDVVALRLNSNLS